MRCMAVADPSSCSFHLPWVEYAHNTHTCARLGYLPPLFPSQEKEIVVPLVQHNFRCCRRVWWLARQALLRITQQNKQFANRHHVPAPQYQEGQSVWLSAKSVLFQSTSKKLALRFIGPFTICKVVNPAAVKLALPARRIHPVFHVSQVKPCTPDPHQPAAQAPPPPWLIDNAPAFTVQCIMGAHFCHPGPLHSERLSPSTP